jgi:hypothetical protein
VTVPTTIDAAGWLSKHLAGDDGDTDLARAMLQSFAETLMSAQAQMLCGRLPRVQRRAGQLPQRLPVPPVGHPGGHDRPGRPEATRGHLLPGLAAGAPLSGRTGG